MARPYYRIQDVSAEVGDYIRSKGLRASPQGWRDVYAQEHARAFTVAKMKELDLLRTVQREIGRSIEHGDTFANFQQRIQPKLQKWLNSVRSRPKKDLRGSHPLRGDQLERYRQNKDRYRLRRIFETNTRQAYAQHQYQRGMDNEFATHIIYRIGPSINHRLDHLALDATVLPKGDSFWDTHYPPNGWGCKCHVRFITKGQLDKYRQEGVPDLESASKKTGYLTKTKSISEQRPKIQWRLFERRPGEFVRVPMDVDPGFEWNPGQLNRGSWLKDMALRKARALELAGKQQAKAAQQIVHHPRQQQAYQSFVQQHYMQEKSGKDSFSVGAMQEAEASYLAERGQEPVAMLLEASSKRLARTPKNLRHQQEGNALSAQEWLELPQKLQGKKVEVYYDSEHRNLLYVYPAKGGRVIKIAVWPNFTEAGNTVNSVRTVFKVDREAITSNKFLKRVR